MRETEKRRYVAEALVFCLALCRGWGRTRINRLVSRPGFDPCRAWQAIQSRNAAELIQSFETEVHALPVEDLPEKIAEAERLVSEVRRRDIQVLLPGDAAYPPRWRAALNSDAPPFALALGNLELARRDLLGGVAGTREPTLMGRDVARRCGQSLAEQGAVVVSGGAAGVDTEAHDAALESGGQTIFIVPADITTYRSAWIRAAHAGTALFLAECLPGASWSTHAAVQRNRLIAALSRALWIVEPREEGGSIRTARVACSLGRPVACYGPPPSLRAALPWEIIDRPDRITPASVSEKLGRPPRRQGDLFQAPDS
ncbi:MAG: DNA-processing protein DprA [Candidatus Hydrogenedentes bacterium]|nr:DNA-processing protein DprA [Candidatus Hydrogenedentota bacterium]